MADRNFKSGPPAWRPPPQHLEAAAAYIIGSICQMMAMAQITAMEVKLSTYWRIKYLPNVSTYSSCQHFSQHIHQHICKNIVSPIC